MGTSTQHRHAKRAFEESYRDANYCNWCGKEVVKSLIHHGDGNPSNNEPHNLWTLCSVGCHAHVHDALLDGIAKIRALGGLATARKGGGLKKLHKDGFFTPERQSQYAKMGVGECKARGARVANAKRVKCPNCERIMNPGALGMHKRVHGGDSD